MIISCFWNSEGRATEEKPDPNGFRSSSRQTEGSESSLARDEGLPVAGLQERDVLGTSTALPGFLEGAKHAGKQNGSLIH